MEMEKETVKQNESKFVSPEVKFIIGTQNMINAKLSGELLRMHRFVVGDDLDEGFLKRWLDNEKNTGPRYIAYIDNKNGTMASMVSGTINNDDMYVINTATLPDLRQKGYLKMILASLYLVCGNKEMNAKLKQLYGQDFTNIQKIFTLFNGPNKKDFITLDSELINKINENAKNIIEIKDPEAKKYGQVSISFGKIVQSIKDFLPNENISSFGEILKNKFCFKNNIFQSLERDIKFNPSICYGANTVNYTPSVNNDGMLGQYSQQVREQFRIRRKKSFDTANPNTLGTENVNQKQKVQQ